MSQILSKENVEKLQNEYEILHLIYHRNYNQHRASIWWKYLNILHRQLRKILKLFIDIRSISDRKTENAEVFSSKIREISDYLLLKIITKSYYAFNGIIALGQFIALGFTLVGALGRVFCILSEIPGITKPKGKIKFILENKNSPYDTSITDFGEVVEFSEIVSEETGNQAKYDDTRELKTSQKKKKKKKRDFSLLNESDNSSTLASEPSVIQPEVEIDADLFAKKIKKSAKKSSHKKKIRNAIDDIFG